VATRVVVIVTAESGATRTYTVAVARAPLYLKASNTDVIDWFGWSVARSADGSTLAVGAPGEASSSPGVNGDQAPNLLSSAGAVYVFTRAGDSWAQQAYVKASNPGQIDSFGLTVALSADGSTLAVGAPHEDSAATGIGGNQTSNAALGAGAVYVFTRSGMTWSQQAYIKASNTDADDRFGSAVALSADGATLAVGAPQESSAEAGINGNQASNTLASSGAVYVFTRTGTAWSQQAYVKASNPGTYDAFGEALALAADGSTLAVGAAFESTTANDSGAAYVFTRTGATWSQQATVKAGDTRAHDLFGNAVTLSADGTTLAVGATEGGPTAGGAVYVFRRNGSLWPQEARLLAANADAEDYFGYSLSLSSDGLTVAIGAPSEGSAAAGLDGDAQGNGAALSGAAYVFQKSGGAWSQLAYVKAPNTGAGDQFGVAVALAPDAAELIVTACYEDSAATGVGGSDMGDGAEDSGAAYEYR
jgi:hypothetical protein